MVFTGHDDHVDLCSLNRHMPSMENCTQTSCTFVPNPFVSIPPFSTMKLSRVFHAFVSVG